MPNEKDWSRLLEPYAKANNRRAFGEVLLTLSLFAASWCAMYYSIDVSYMLTLGLAFPTAFLFVRMFTIQHDCGHGSFFESRTQNNRVGGLLGVLTLTPYTYWKRGHAIHHATSGDLDRRGSGIITWTTDEYHARGRLAQLAYRAYRNPAIFLTVGQLWVLGWKHRFPSDGRDSFKRGWKSVLYTNIAATIVAAALIAMIGWKKFFLVELPVIAIAGACGIWLFYVQHEFQNAYWRRGKEWNFFAAAIKGSSFYDLPKVARWFTGNIGYHHIHHMAVKIPLYALPACHEKVPEVRKGINRLTFFESLRCAKLALWDERRGRLIGFSELDRDD